MRRDYLGPAVIFALLLGMGGCHMLSQIGAAQALSMLRSTAPGVCK